MTSSIMPVFRISGTNPAPIPWILCGPGWPPLRTGLSSGSTAMVRNPGLRALITSLTPVRVPPVPTPEIRISALPSVSFQISSAVVSRWICGFAGFLNCWGMMAPGISANSSSALAIAPFMPFAASVSCSSAPNSLSILRRSIDMLSGIVRIRR